MDIFQGIYNLQSRLIIESHASYDEGFVKVKGFFILVTELTDDLLQPVSQADYVSWRKWLVETFSSIGFKIIRIIDEGSPLCFSSHYLDKFKNDSQRIKIISLVMVKYDI